MLLLVPAISFSVVSTGISEDNAVSGTNFEEALGLRHLRCGFGVEFNRLPKRSSSQTACCGSRFVGSDTGYPVRSQPKAQTAPRPATARRHYCCVGWATTALILTRNLLYEGIPGLGLPLLLFSDTSPTLLDSPLCEAA